MFDSDKLAQSAKNHAFCVEFIFLEDSGHHYCSCPTLSHVADKQRVLQG